MTNIDNNDANDDVVGILTSVIMGRQGVAGTHDV